MLFDKSHTKNNTIVWLTYTKMDAFLRFLERQAVVSCLWRIEVLSPLGHGIRSPGLPSFAPWFEFG
jgi:hypothetical protein